MQQKLIGLLFLLFLLEGTIMPWLIPEWWQDHVIIAPHFVLVMIIYTALYLNRHLALFYGLLFGIFQDIIFYGHMIGIYSFAMGLTGYLAGLAFRRSHIHMASILSFIVIGNLLYEMTVYGIYRLFSIVSIPLSWIFMKQMLPSVLLNLLFALLIYVPVRKLLEQAELRRRTEESK